jgi:hypothetical protein
MSILKDHGLAWVMIPSEGIKPLQLLEKIGTGQVRQLNSNLTALFIPKKGILPPKISPEKSLPKQLNFEESFDLGMEANFSFLKNILSVFSSNAGANFKLNNQKKISIKLGDPVKQHVGSVELDIFLKNSTPNKDAESTIKSLKGDDLYIITEVIKTGKIALVSDKSSGFEGRISVPTTTVEGDLKTDLDKEKKSEILAESDKKLTVAIKAVRIFYDKPGFFHGGPGKFRISEDEKISVVKGSEKYPTVPVDDYLLTFESE